jgi:transcriptional regulator with XRE-family HTH domain
MNAVRELRELTGMTQVELARRAGTSQPTIAAYEAGAKSPTMRTVGRLARAAGLDLIVSFVPPLTREDRRSLHLHRRIARRLRSDPVAVRDIAKANLDLMWARQRGARPLLEEWRRILQGPADEIARAMTDPGAHARDLRQVTPFAGVLTATERAEAYRSFRRSEAA